MTRTLDTAIAKLAALPSDEHDRIGRWLLQELADDEHWALRFWNLAGSTQQARR
jgi:hypothetical protein